MKAAALCVLLAVPLLCGACGNNNSSTTAPTGPITETFSGTVAVAGSDFHNVTVNGEGEIAVTLTAAGPPATIVMGLAVGVPSASGCTPIAGASRNVSAGSAALSGTVTAGVVCVLVTDIGNATAPVAYSVSVTHP